MTNQTSNSSKNENTNTVDLVGVKNRDAFSNALKETKYGDKINYHIGQHAGGPFRLDALMANQAGLVSVVQKKVGSGIFQYIAQRTKKIIK
jgi:hypothetical protein|tara:strand:- start:105 stop:377 length:273 start_codon:yes stop_codon:yes gene_type:complete